MLRITGIYAILCPKDFISVTRKNYQFAVGKGYIVVRLDGSIEWMGRAEFKELLGKQQTQAEIKLLQQQPREF